MVHTEVSQVRTPGDYEVTGQRLGDSDIIEETDELVPNGEGESTTHDLREKRTRMRTIERDKGVWDPVPTLTCNSSRSKVRVLSCRGPKTLSSKLMRVRLLHSVKSPSSFWLWCTVTSCSFRAT